MILADCPADNELREWAMGRLSPDAVDRVASHVESCANCSGRVSTFDQLSDPLMYALRVPPQEDAREAALQPGAVLGDYVLGEELGAGGMGRVFRATHVRMRREVALKVVSQRATTRTADAARRFAREVEVAGRLLHPNIAIAYDAREQDGIIYLILEYIGGTDLARLVAETGPLPEAVAVEYIVQAARGLAYAHSRGIVHRDVKPANLMRSNDGGVIKVLDMGLSRLRDTVEPATSAGAPDHASATVGQDVTRVGDVLGTLDFVAPEQASSPAEADHRADIYSLGCTLFYLMTGRSPGRRKTVADVVEAEQGQPVPPLRDACPAV
jgi:serine/threonine protein kinase